jgi:hypothetical protein
MFRTPLLVTFLSLLITTHNNGELGTFQITNGELGTFQIMNGELGTFQLTNGELETFQLMNGELETFQRNNMKSPPFQRNKITFKQKVGESLSALCNQSQADVTSNLHTLRNTRAKCRKPAELVMRMFPRARNPRPPQTVIPLQGTLVLRTLLPSPS